MTPQELKNSILQLAIAGKLVKQRAEEGTAEELFAQIQAEKQRLIAEGKLKKQKPLPEITEEEKPFDIPESWKWVRLGEVVTVLGDGIHGTPQYSTNGNYYFINGNNLSRGKIALKPNTKKVDETEYNKYKVEMNEQTILVSINGTIGNYAFFDQEPIILGKSACYFSLISIDKQYICNCITSPYFFSFVNEQSTKTTISNVSLKSMRMLPIPLPPLAEQKRIVAKIEQLLPYIDRYEKAWIRLQKFNKRFPSDMQKSLLQYAIEGKLVEQRAEEGTAEELFAQIQAEKQRLVAEGKLKKQKPLPEITEEEKPFDIPESWKWVRLGEVTSYNQQKEKISAQDITDEMWSLDLEDIEKESGRIIKRCYAKEREIKGDKVKFYSNQILYSKLRPYLKKILVADTEGICSSEIVPFYAYGKIEPEFMVYFLKSPFVDFTINSVTYGVKMPRVGTETMINLLFPLPPLAEQKRIVAPLEELLPLCDRLKK